MDAQREDFVRYTTGWRRHNGQTRHMHNTTQGGALQRERRRRRGLVQREGWLEEGMYCTNEVVGDKSDDIMGISGCFWQICVGSPDESDDVSPSKESLAGDGHPTFAA
jgi:hypothetical protein